MSDIEQKFSINQDESDVFEIEKIGNPFQNFKHFQIQHSKRIVGCPILLMKICDEKIHLFSWFSALQEQHYLLNVDIEVDTGLDHEFYISGKGEANIVFVPENCDEEELAKHYKEITYMNGYKPQTKKEYYELKTKNMKKYTVTVYHSGTGEENLCNTAQVSSDSFSMALLLGEYEILSSHNIGVVTKIEVEENK